MLLAGELVQCARPHPRRQRLGALQVLLVEVAEEIHNRASQSYFPLAPDRSAEVHYIYLPPA
jgi:hypothetical protein